MKADVVILGSSFSGSLLAWILAGQGLRVVLIDQSIHPRFAIGESSTPVADMLLEHLASRWQLPALAPLARFGSWQRHYPQLTCGKKRGFSYFRHRPGVPFSDSPEHDASLLVAASSSDAESDTHWLREDVDCFLFRQAVAAGVTAHEGVSIDALEPDAAGWSVRWHVRGSNPRTSHTTSGDWLIDSTGSGSLLGRRLGLARLDATLTTQTSAIFGHFRDVDSWDAAEITAGNLSTTWPFCSDDAAQHHLLEEGWIWLLRFVDGRSSAGLVVPRRSSPGSAAGEASAEAFWQGTLDRYPGLAQMFSRSEPCRPVSGCGQLSRLWSVASGPRWAMLPTTAGFVDPLHSTGIAHALHGVARLADCLTTGRDPALAVTAYGPAVQDEVRWIDTLVSVAYATMQDFDLFVAACQLYLLATIDFEHRLLNGEPPESSGFLAADQPSLRFAITSARNALARIARAPAGASEREAVLATLRTTLTPWDRASMFTAATPHRLPHTAARKAAMPSRAQPQIS